MIQGVFTDALFFMEILMTTLTFRGRPFQLNGFPKLMGILNVTPDSFSDGGSTIPLKERIQTLIAHGADIIDIGGESTRPGSQEVPVEEELNRVLPAVRAVRELSHDIFISIDTRKSAVAEEALKLGADIVNDVSGFLFDPGLAEVTARYDAGAIIMHSRATPDRMQAQENLHYSGGLIETVIEELRIMVDNVLKAGVRQDAIILDPGIGFAKTAEQSAALINEAEKLLKLGYPLLSGPSRKSFIGQIIREPVASQRDYGTCGSTIASAVKGYGIIRIHNVKAASDALKVYYSCMGMKNSGE